MISVTTPFWTAPLKLEYKFSVKGKVVHDKKNTLQQRISRRNTQQNRTHSIDGQSGFQAREYCEPNAAQNHPDIRGAIHHTDTDVRYCSAQYTAAAFELELNLSMTLGNVYENAHSESLNKTIKRQEINVNEYKGKL